MPCRWALGWGEPPLFFTQLVGGHCWFCRNQQAEAQGRRGCELQREVKVWVGAHTPPHPCAVGRQQGPGDRERPQAFLLAAASSGLFPACSEGSLGHCLPPTTPSSGQGCCLSSSSALRLPAPPCPQGKGPSRKRPTDFAAPQLTPTRSFALPRPSPSGSRPASCSPSSRGVLGPLQLTRLGLRPGLWTPRFSRLCPASIYTPVPRGGLSSL